MDLSATSIKTPARVSLINFVYALEDYGKNNKGEYPITWNEFDRKVDPRFKPVIDSSVELVDLKNRYIFLNPHPEFWSWSSCKPRPLCHCRA